MPEKLLQSLRADADGLRARKLEFEKGLAPLQKLALLAHESEAKRTELLEAVLANPTDGKALTAFRSSVASIAADAQVVNAANARIRTLRDQFDLECVPLFTDLIDRARAIALARLKHEGFALDMRPGYTHGNLVEVGSEHVAHPNTPLGQAIYETYQTLGQLLFHKNHSPAGLTTVLSLVDSVEI
jgi:hypothetical protein